MKKAPDLQPALRRRELKGAAGRDGEHKWRRLFLAILVVALLHLPFLLLKQGMEKHQEEQAPSRLAAIARPENLTTSQEEALWQWIRMLDPSQWYYPTEEGFSRFNRRAPLPWPEAPRFSLSPQAPSPLSLPENRLELRLPPPDDSVLLPAPPALEPLVAEWKPTPFPPLPPQWRRLGGGVLESPPSLSPESLALLEDPEIRRRLWDRQGALGGVAEPATVMELQFLPGFSMPRVLLRASCGIDELDQAALKALRGFLRRQAGPRLWEGIPASRFSLCVEWLR